MGKGIPNPLLSTSFGRRTTILPTHPTRGRERELEAFSSVVHILRDEQYLIRSYTVPCMLPFAKRISNRPGKSSLSRSWVRHWNSVCTLCTRCSPGPERDLACLLSVVTFCAPTVQAADRNKCSGSTLPRSSTKEEVKRGGRTRYSAAAKTGRQEGWWQMGIVYYPRRCRFRSEGALFHLSPSFPPSGCP